MSRQRYPEEFKIEAVKQVTEKGKPAPMSPSAWACPYTAFTPGSRSTASECLGNQGRFNGTHLVELVCFGLGGLGLERCGVVSHVVACAAGNVARFFETNVGEAPMEKRFSLPCSRYFNRQTLEGDSPTLHEAPTSK